MITKHELTDAINCIEESEASWEKIEKLAHLYEVWEHLYGEKATDEGTAEQLTVSAQSSDSEFMKAIEGKDTHDVLSLVDEMIQTISVSQPRLYESIMRRVNEI